MKLFITGATGFLGKYILNDLIDFFDVIYVLTRSPENFKSWNNSEKIVCIEGDITHPEVIKDSSIRKKILEEVTHIIHAAALYDLKASFSDCHLQNVVGTQNIIRIAKRAKSLSSFYYISTIAVGDEQRFYLYEDELPHRSHFNDHYSHTKYLAEELVRRGSYPFVVRIIRPGIIVGESKTGVIEKLDGPYYFIKCIRDYLDLLKKTPMIPLSFSPRTSIPMIPVDHCSSLIALIVKRDDFKQSLKSYHLISEECPTIQRFLNDLKDSYSLRASFIPVPQNFLHSYVLDILGVPKEVLPFMFSRLSFDKSRTNLELPELLESRYTNYKKIFSKF